MTSPTLGTAPPSQRADDDHGARRAARGRVYELLRSAQLEGELTSEIVAAIIDDAELRGWSDVVKLGMFLAIFCERWVARGTGAAQIEILLERAEHDRDPVMTALALAARAQDLTIADGRAPIDADRDLARAIVLLEGWTIPSSEAVSAHIECAYACEERDLWELQLRHWEAAEACLDWSEGGVKRREVLLYNRAETEVTWLTALRERGLHPDLATHADRARRALKRADLPTMPASWREYLQIFRELVDAISPPASGAPPASSRVAEGLYAGHVHLTRALTAGDAAQARAHCDRALQAIDPVTTSRIHLFALALAVELEAAEAGRETAGLRWGRELVARRWERRLGALSSVESFIDVERREAEHAQLQRHAYLDDLTGLANRRALSRFIDGLGARGETDVAVAVVDLDRFKAINDGHGHAVGDEVLARTAAILRSGVREQNLVARLGGDEFLLVLTMDDLATARRRCATIVDAVGRSRWDELGPGLSVTASAGVAHGPLQSFDALTALADAALYRAKQSGGDGVAV